MARRTSKRPKPLIELEGIARPPDDLLRRLREIDPRVELLGVGNDIWWLGRVVFSQQRYHKATNVLKKVRPVDRNRWTRLNAKLALQGFGLISDWQGYADSRILLDFERKDWKLRHGAADDEFEERMRYSDGTIDTERRLALLRDKLHAEKNDIFDFAMRGKRSVSGRITA